MIKQKNDNTHTKMCKSLFHLQDQETGVWLTLIDVLFVLLSRLAPSQLEIEIDKVLLRRGLPCKDSRPPLMI